jgi:hypothetical protein
MNTVLQTLGIIIGFLLAVGLILVVVVMIGILIDWSRIILLELKIKRITKKIKMDTKRYKVMHHEKD